MKTKTMYMHTLDGQPAAWNDRLGGYIHYCSERNPVTLQPDLKTIRKQQAIDRGEHAEERFSGFVYGYVRVKVPV